MTKKTSMGNPSDLFGLSSPEVSPGCTCCGRKAIPFSKWSSRFWWCLFYVCCWWWGWWSWWREDASMRRGSIRHLSAGRKDHFFGSLPSYKFASDSVFTGPLVVVGGFLSLSLSLSLCSGSYSSTCQSDTMTDPYNIGSRKCQKMLFN